MFNTPKGDTTAVVVAAQCLCDRFLGIVTAVVGEADAERYAATLLTGAHGAAGLESSGLLVTDKWRTNAHELVENFVSMVQQG